MNELISALKKAIKKGDIIVQSYKKQLNKVFCVNCEHYYYRKLTSLSHIQEGFYLKKKEECHHKKNYINDYKNENSKLNRKPIEINKNNNCKWFKFTLIPKGPPDNKWEQKHKSKAIKE